MLLASVSGVFASDDNSVDANLTSENNNDNILELDNVQSSEILSDAPGTFKALNTDISNAENVLELRGNYTYNPETDNDFKDGITINKKITINGNGYTIDAGNSARIFNIRADGVILNNITIKNGFLNTTADYSYTSYRNVNISDANGAGILWSGANGVLNNSIIINNNIQADITFWNISDINVGYYIGNGAGVYWSGDNAQIENTLFYNNTIDVNLVRKYMTTNETSNYNLTIRTSDGSALYIKGNNSIVRKSIFSNNIIINGTVNSTDERGRGTNVNLLIDLNGKSYGNISVANIRAALFWDGDNGLVIDSVFDQNIALNSGAIHWVGNNGTVNNSNFTNNHVINSNGAVYMNGANGTISNSKFINNSAFNNGAVYVGGENGVVIDSIFENNTAENSAAALTLSGDNGILKNTKFTNNVVTNGNQPVYWESVNGILDGLVFINNSAYSNAALFVSAANVTLTNSVFINNTANGGNQGAVYWSGTMGTINNTNFTGNKATTNAGALRTSSNMLIYNSNFFNNTAKNGGAIYLNGNSGIIENCNFINNAGTLGDGIYLAGIAYSIVNSTFKDNGVAIYGREGTSVYLDSNNVYNSDICNLTNVTLLENRDFYISPTGNGNGMVDTPANWTYAFTNIAQGRIIYLKSGVYTDIINQTINKTVKLIGLGDVTLDLGGKGNAFTISSPNTLIYNIKFINGNSVNGGALNWAADYATLINCTFINNTATRGGAIYLTNLYGVIVNSSFINNSASISNDIYNTHIINLTNNIFIGDYIKIGKTILLGHENTYLKVTAPNYNFNVNVYIDGVLFNTAIVNANITGDSELNIAGLSAGEHTINVLFEEGSGNKYANNVVKSFRLVEYPTVIYVSPNGSGSGDNENSPTNFNNAIENLAVYNSTIILLNGTYTGIVDYALEINNIVIKGCGNSIIDASNKGIIFNVLGEYVLIDNIKFINGYNSEKGGAVIWEGMYGTISNSIFSNNHADLGGAVYWTGTYGLIINSKFINNTANKCGAVEWEGSEGSIINSTFINNSANIGSLVWDGMYGSLFNSTFINSFSSQSVGATYWYGANGIIDGCKFINNTANVSNSALVVEGNNVVLKDSVFTNNTALTGNSVIYWFGNYGSMSNSSLINNKALKGSRALNSNSVQFYIKDCQFISNQASTKAAVVIYGSDSVMINCSFINNTAVVGNEGTLTWGASNGIIDGCKFINNHANVSNAAVYITSIGVNTVLMNCLIMDNCAVNGNNALYWVADYGQIINTTFINNTAPNGNRGVASITGKYMNIDNCSFINNSAKTESGALTIGGSNAYVHDSVFNNNHANQIGALYINGINSVIDNVLFINNRAETSLGAMKGDKSNISVSNSIFINNTAGATGALSLTGSNSVIFNSSFINNTALSGNQGALIFQSANGVINTSTFIGNVANANGAIYAWGSNFIIFNSSFINNVARDGNNGAIYLGGANGVVNNSIFIGNSATGKGGAIRNANSISVTIVDSIFIGNSANNGGAIYLEFGDSIIGCSFVNNSAKNNGGGVYITTNANLIVKGSSFFNNTAKKGSAIYTDHAINVNNSIFSDNLASDSSLTYAKIDDNSFNLTYGGADSHINAIKRNSDGVSVVLFNVTYWNGTALINTEDDSAYYLTSGVNQTIVVELTNKVTDELVGEIIRFTDVNSKVVVDNLLDSYYYVGYAYHGVGPSRKVYTNFEHVTNTGIHVPSLNVTVGEVIYSGDNVTFTANIDNGVMGNITFIISNNNYSRVIDNGVSTLTVPVNLLAGEYNVTVVYDGGNNYYGQRNHTSFSVKVASNPNVYIGVPSNTVINGTTLNLTAISNFNNGAISVLQFVVLTNTWNNCTIFC